MAKEKIVIVDDEKLIRDLLSEVLSNSGYTIIYTGDNIGAVDLLDTYDGNIDLVITDLRMANIDGLLLSQFYRAKYPKIKILIITGNVGFDGIESINKDDNAMIVEKPFSFSELAVMVRGFLDT